MEFRNLTPFEALAFSAYDVHDAEHHVVVLKVVHRLVPDGGADTHRCELAPGDARGKLSLADASYGELNASSVRAESDIAPFKPRCDVIVRATAHAPGGVPTARWQVALRVSTPERGVLIDKTLMVCGPRWFERVGGAWAPGEPAPTAAVPMRWERALGGRCVVPDPDAPPGEARHLLNEVCFTNPVGAGWIESRYLDALARAGHDAPTRLPAPQVEHPDDPVTALVITEHPPHAVDAPQMAELAAGYGHRPAGLGFVGRAWTPRLQRAGTYDDDWLARRHPFLPDDFSFAYWNAAPDDQQIPWPDLGARFELAHLAAPEHTRDGALSFTLPPHRAFVMATLQGLPVPVPAVVDTVVVDTEEMTVTCLWRALLSRSLGVGVLEARYEMDPDAPLLKLEGNGPHG